MRTRMIAGVMLVVAVLAGCGDADEESDVTTTSAMTAQPPETSVPDSTPFVPPEEPDCAGGTALAEPQLAGSVGTRVGETADGEYLCLDDGESSQALLLEPGSVTAPEFVTPLVTASGHWWYLFRVPSDWPADVRVLADGDQEVVSVRTSDGRHLVVVDPIPVTDQDVTEVPRQWTVVDAGGSTLAELRGEGPQLG